jgi:hypothetical protein
MKRKSRMISFRLSDQEYEHLVNLCQTQGARSLSDLARAAMQCLITNGGANGSAGIEERVSHLDGRVKVLDRAVERLSQIVATAGGPGE